MVGVDDRLSTGATDGLLTGERVGYCDGAGEGKRVVVDVEYMSYEQGSECRPIPITK
jgi:hypothetical protein